MRNLSHQTRVFLCTSPVDMRKSFQRTRKTEKGLLGSKRATKSPLVLRERKQYRRPRPHDFLLTTESLYRPLPLRKSVSSLREQRGNTGAPFDFLVRAFEHICRSQTTPMSRLKFRSLSRVMGEWIFPLQIPLIFMLS